MRASSGEASRLMNRSVFVRTETGGTPGGGVGLGAKSGGRTTSAFSYRSKNRCGASGGLCGFENPQARKNGSSLCRRSSSIARAGHGAVADVVAVARDHVDRVRLAGPDLFGAPLALPTGELALGDSFVFSMALVFALALASAPAPLPEAPNPPPAPGLAPLRPGVSVVDAAVEDLAASERQIPVVLEESRQADVVRVFFAEPGPVAQDSSDQRDIARSTCSSARGCRAGTGNTPDRTARPKPPGR